MLSVGNLLLNKQSQPIIRAGNRITIRCDRQSVLGNPFDLVDKKDEVERLRVIQAYREWIWENMKQKRGIVSLLPWIQDQFDENGVQTFVGFKVASRFKAPKAEEVLSALYEIVNLEKESLDLQARGEKPYQISLMCWCAPLPCHSDIIKNAAKYLLDIELSKNSATYQTATSAPIHERRKTYTTNQKVFLVNKRDMGEERIEKISQSGGVIFDFDSYSPIRSPFKASSWVQRKSCQKAYKVWLSKNLKTVESRRVSASAIAKDYNLFFCSSTTVPTPQEVKEKLLDCTKAKSGFYIVSTDTDSDSMAKTLRDFLASLGNF